MEFDDKLPIYYQIKQYFYHEIIVGRLALGAKLPSVRQIAVALTVNVNTVQRALAEMETEKVITSQRGKGNFVTEDVQRVLKLKEQLIQVQLKQLYEELKALNIGDDGMVTYLKQYIEMRREND
ncbi:GntR family transcriptional regulator [Loigolactobacillus bifermentans]|uniref:Transcriptional regulator n=1 Tax=Loigolactobacillus bifermentans DSM 20003 TaxID=1423726 RepID=A0A0R1GRN2_9LACO|nr:GntR family transcriptional regulator [Loigolactobacillus bifermentans]KRK36409.1 transcriptional regulator [Loigolactobacillus bifermentans DSM 20003]QGG60648.1 GntR family transcriptional regulator [Loigolactobacillus bifermentans]